MQINIKTQQRVKTIKHVWEIHKQNTYTHTWVKEQIREREYL